MRKTTQNTPKAPDQESVLSDELDKQRRQVSYDSYDILIRQLVDLVAEKAIDISPEYQRRFVWDDIHQSKFIESIFLGIPIPSLFMATNRDSTWEVIDGVQRISTVIRFCGTPKQKLLPAGWCSNDARVGHSRGLVKICIAHWVKRKQDS